MTPSIVSFFLLQKTILRPYNHKYTIIIIYGTDVKLCPCVVFSSGEEREEDIVMLNRV